MVVDARRRACPIHIRSVMRRIRLTRTSILIIRGSRVVSMMCRPDIIISHRISVRQCISLIIRI